MQVINSFYTEQNNDYPIMNYVVRENNRKVLKSIISPIRPDFCCFSKDLKEMGILENYALKRKTFTTFLKSLDQYIQRLHQSNNDEISERRKDVFSTTNYAINLITNFEGKDKEHTLKILNLYAEEVKLSLRAKTDVSKGERLMLLATLGKLEKQLGYINRSFNTSETMIKYALEEE